MTAAEAVLLSLAGGAWPTDEAGWGEVLDRAQRQRLAGLLAEYRPESTPPAAAQALRHAALVAAAAAVRARAQLAELLAAAAAADLPIVLLKGAGLAETVYDQPWHRGHGDLDLLVRRADLGRAQELTFGLGYTTSEAMEADHHHLPTLHRRASLPVEWHWRPIDPLNAPGLDGAELERLWQRSQPVAVSGQPASVLAPEDHLLVLATHWALTDRCGGGFRPLLDVAQLVERSPDLDWGALAERAQAWGVDRGLRLTLALAAEASGRQWPGLDAGGVPMQVRERAWQRIRLEARVRPSGRLADAAGTGWRGWRLLLRARLKPPGDPLSGARISWWRHAGDLWRRNRGRLGGLFDSAYRAEMAKEARLARWLAGGR